MPISRWVAWSRAWPPGRPASMTWTYARWAARRTHGPSSCWRVAQLPGAGTAGLDQADHDSGQARPWLVDKDADADAAGEGRPVDDEFRRLGGPRHRPRGMLNERVDAPHVG